LSVAGSIFVAQYSGARQHRMVSHVAAQTILMVVLVSVALSVLGSLAADLVLRATGIAPNVLALGSAYVRITFPGLVFSYGFMMFQAILQGAGEVRFPGVRADPHGNGAFVDDAVARAAAGVLVAGYPDAAGLQRALVGLPDCQRPGTHRYTAVYEAVSTHASA
jgi:hypothetical protein